MTKARRRSRKQVKPIGVRALLLSLALGGTLGGWVGLANAALRTAKNTGNEVSPSPPPPIVTSQPQYQPSLPPIPTIVPPPDMANEVNITWSQNPPPPTLKPIPAIPQPVMQRPAARTRTSR